MRGSVKNEREFLKAQGEQAKRRFFNSAETLATHLLDKVNVAKWTRQYPFQSTTIAAGVGFVVAQNIPSSSQPKPISESSESKPVEKVKQSSALSALLFPIIYEAATDILKNSLMPFIQGAFSSNQGFPEEVSEPEENPNQNGDF